uniref:Uncharacterized protein n=1 Tax=Mastacembelus armatus TaxID=205130 RepID=A0A7N8WI76_9TELE
MLKSQSFRNVYIDEAHPSDGWVAPPMAAHKLIQHFSLPPQSQLVADCMDNNVSGVARLSQTTAMVKKNAVTHTNTPVTLLKVHVLLYR